MARTNQSGKGDRGDFSSSRGTTPASQENFNTPGTGVSVATRAEPGGLSTVSTVYDGGGFNESSSKDQSRISESAGLGSVSTPSVAAQAAERGTMGASAAPAAPGASFTRALADSTALSARENRSRTATARDPKAEADRLTDRYAPGLLDPTPSVNQRGTITAPAPTPGAPAARSVVSKDARAPGATMLTNQRDPYGLNENPRAFTPGRVDEVKSLAPVLEAIRTAEARPGNAYNSLVYGDRTPTTADLENMTISEVRALQSGMRARGHASTAVGAYQTLASTLDGAVRALGLNPSTTKFDQATQDRIGAYLAQQRGYDDYQSGRITAEQYADRLAREWAGLPTASGQSYYAGVGKNAATISRSEILDAIAAIEEMRSGPPNVDLVDRVLAALPPERPNNLPTVSQFGTGPTAGMAGMDRFENVAGGIRSPGVPFRGPEGNFAMFGGVPAGARPSVSAEVVPGAAPRSAPPSGAFNLAGPATPPGFTPNVLGTEAIRAGAQLSSTPTMAVANPRASLTPPSSRPSVQDVIAEALGITPAQAAPGPPAAPTQPRSANSMGPGTYEAPPAAVAQPSPLAAEATPLPPAASGPTIAPPEATQARPAAPAPAPAQEPRIAPDAPIAVTNQPRSRQARSANSAGPDTYEDTRDPISRTLQALGLDTTPASPVTPAPDNWFSRNVAPALFGAAAGPIGNIASFLGTGSTVRGNARSWSPGNDLTIGTRPQDLERDGSAPERIEPESEQAETEREPEAAPAPTDDEALRELLARLIGERLRDATSARPLAPSGRQPPPGRAIAPDPIVATLAEIVRGIPGVSDRPRIAA